jgi:hypothetical protein
MESKTSKDWEAVIKEKAQELADGLFYSDIEQRIPWEPFADYSPEWVAEQCEEHAAMIEKILLTCPRRDPLLDYIDYV